MTVGFTVQVSHPLQRRGQSQDGAAVEAGASGQLGQGQPVRSLGERLEQRQRPLYGLDPLFLRLFSG
ncbi:hypothetical protein Ae406Ps2_5918 [Pseudonocardia sp. Ae406_Ps2]|nr:hypothetical protein Ae406Ps2_5918 [Pseudonocardia sp. Ae406_Ps2]